MLTRPRAVETSVAGAVAQSFMASRSRSSSSSSSSSSSDEEARRQRREERKRRKKEKKERKKDKSRHKEKKEKKHRKEKKHKREKERGPAAAAAPPKRMQWGAYGIIRESSYAEKQEEFLAWLTEVKGVPQEQVPRLCRHTPPLEQGVPCRPMV